MVYIELEKLHKISLKNIASEYLNFQIQCRVEKFIDLLKKGVSLPFLKMSLWICIVILMLNKIIFAISF